MRGLHVTERRRGAVGHVRVCSRPGAGVAARAETNSITSLVVSNVDDAGPQVPDLMSDDLPGAGMVHPHHGHLNDPRGSRLDVLHSDSELNSRYRSPSGNRQHHFERHRERGGSHHLRHVRFQRVHSVNSEGGLNQTLLRKIRPLTPAHRITCPNLRCDPVPRFQRLQDLLHDLPILQSAAIHRDDWARSHDLRSSVLLIRRSLPAQLVPSDRGAPVVGLGPLEHEGVGRPPSAHRWERRHGGHRGSAGGLALVFPRLA
mmetsp:Transcript_25331/g.65045  ORF Transcript_25331/g.65045 Transcript_25331/m.65045 type:complete len:259 (-) Transcript_25331:3708-4484(-)